MKAVTVAMMLSIALARIGMSVAAPMADLATAPSLQPREAGAAALRNVSLTRDGAHYKLGRRVGLFVDCKELKPANCALGPLETGPAAMPPVRLGRFVVSAEIRVNLF